MIKIWLYAYDAYPTEREVLFKNRPGHDSCVASNVAGELLGVEKKKFLDNYEINKLP